MCLQAGVLYQADQGQFVCDFVERLPTTDTGQRFSLYPWQRETLMEFYSTMEADEDSGELYRKYQYLYLEIPKKNGKSELSAALGIYHLLGDGELNAEVYVVAADKGNASIVFDAAVFMLESAPWTAKMIARGELRVVPSKKKIVYRRIWMFRFEEDFFYLTIFNNLTSIHYSYTVSHVSNNT